MTKRLRLESKSTIVMMLTFAAVLLTFPMVEAESKIIVVPEDYSTIQEAVSNATVYGNNITQNNVGIVLLNFPNAGDVVVSGVGNTVFGNLFANNTKQVSQEERNYNYPNTTRICTDIVSWDNDNVGNYWGEYSGLDKNNDGIGDSPYIIDENNKDNYPLMNSFDPGSNPEFQPLILALPIFLAVGVVLLMIFKKHK